MPHAISSALPVQIFQPTAQPTGSASHGLRRRRPVQVVAALSVLPALAAACSEVRTPANSVLGIWANNTAAKKMSDFSTKKLVYLLTQNCGAVKTQLDTDCNYLVGATQVQKAVNSTLQVSLFSSPFNQSADPSFLNCSQPQLMQWLASKDARGQASSGSRFSDSQLSGIVLASILGVALACTALVLCCARVGKGRQARRDLEYNRAQQLRMEAQRGTSSSHVPAPAPTHTNRSTDLPRYAVLSDSSRLGPSNLGASTGATFYPPAMHGHSGGHHAGSWGGGFDGGGASGGGFGGGGDGGGGGGGC